MVWNDHDTNRDESDDSSYDSNGQDDYSDNNRRTRYTSQQQNPGSQSNIGRYAEVWKKNGFLGLGLDLIFKNDSQNEKGSISERVVNALVENIYPTVSKVITRHPKLPHVAIGIATLGWLVKYMYGNRRAIQKWFMLRIFPSVSVSKRDTVLYRNIMKYARQNAAFRSRHAMAASSGAYVRPSTGASVLNSDQIMYQDASCLNVFKHKKSYFMYSYDQQEQAVRIWSPWSTAASIQEAIDDINSESKRKDSNEDRLEVYSATRIGDTEHYAWKYIPNIYGRSLESVCLKAKVKQKLIEDINIYTNLTGKQFYTSHGIPYRRSYLLHGRTGCGKTSFARAVATRWKLKIYTISLSDRNITDSVLQNLMQSLQEGSLLLLEDIDSVGLSRETLTEAEQYSAAMRGPTTILHNCPSNIKSDDQGDEVKVDEEKSKKKEKDKKNKKDKLKPANGVTISGLLNLLDGAVAPTGFLVIMTTNVLHKLDYALKRDGCFDLRIEFDFACREQIRDMFLNIYEPTRPPTSPPTEPSSDTTEDEEAASSSKTMDDLAEAFADVIPEYEFPLSSIQNFLLLHSVRPEKAIAEAQGWVEVERQDMLEDTDSSGLYSFSTRLSSMSPAWDAFGAEHAQDWGSQKANNQETSTHGADTHGADAEGANT